MNLNKKIVLFVLSMSFHGGIMGMDGRKKLIHGGTMGMDGRKKIVLIAETELGEQAIEVLNFVRGSAQPLEVIRVGTWLNGKRNVIPEKDWMEFVQQFVSDVDKLTLLCDTQVEKEKLSKIKDVINEIASELQPGQDCVRLLLNRTQEELGWTKKSKL